MYAITVYPQTLIKTQGKKFALDISSLHIDKMPSKSMKRKTKSSLEFGDSDESYSISQVKKKQTVLPKSKQIAYTLSQRVKKVANDLGVQPSSIASSFTPGMEDVSVSKPGCTLVKFKNECGETVGVPLYVPLDDCSVENLQKFCNQVLKKEKPLPFLFFIDDEPVKDSLLKTLEGKPATFEKCIDVVYIEQAVFQVRPVTRCSSSIPGHGEAVLSVAFSPDGRHLASGSGDKTVRLWDVNTETPHFTCKGHSNSVLCVSWSPDGKKLASGCENGQILIWNPDNGKQIANLMRHKRWINCLSWEPLHKNPECRRLASASKDGTARVWDVVLQQTLFTIAHKDSVMSVKWGGAGLLYTASLDRSIKVWRAKDGVLCRSLEEHGHWVNTLALNVDFVLRTGAFDPSKPHYETITHSAQELGAIALKRYNSTKGNEPERLVSGSDDNSLILWNPEVDKKPVEKMLGHVNVVNDIKFSPDMRLIASASFDKSIRLWNGRTGKFILRMTGHVQKVYQIAWSADSRLLMSGSEDSTLKVWDHENRRLMGDLPGHADAVYAVDWSPDGERVASGGKDKVLKIWRN